MIGRLTARLGSELLRSMSLPSEKTDEKLPSLMPTPASRERRRPRSFRLSMALRRRSSWFSDRRSPTRKGQTSNSCQPRRAGCDDLRQVMSAELILEVEGGESYVRFALPAPLQSRPHRGSSGGQIRTSNRSGNARGDPCENATRRVAMSASGCAESPGWSEERRRSRPSAARGRTARAARAVAKKALLSV